VPLADDRIARYARQLLVPGIGEPGQERLAQARVRVVGAGPAAGPALVYLVQAGVAQLWIDDPETISPADLSAWLYPPGAVGAVRADAAAEALRPLSRFVKIDPYPTGGVPSATLVCAPSVAQALHAAEAARRAGLPHVVAEVDGEGGVVVSVPAGGPCFACNRATDATGRPASAGAAALGALAALELVQLLADPASTAGRRIDLVRGVTGARPTQRLPGCACAEKKPAAAPAGP
jgi:molybdopterin/thiamine biosynthesis adenylyltransferase